MKRLALINKDRDDFQYNSGDLVYKSVKTKGDGSLRSVKIISPLTSQLRVASRKVSIKYIGSLAI